MAIKLSSEEKRVAKVRMSELNELYRQKAQCEVLKKSREEDLKTQVAQILDIKDKKGEAQPSKVKLPILMNLLEEMYNQGVNKKQEEYELMLEYRRALDQIPKDQAIPLLDVIAEIKGINADIKYAFATREGEEEDSAVILPGEIIDTIALIGKDNFKVYKTEELEKAGFKVPEPKEEAFDYEELKRELKEELGDE